MRVWEAVGEAWNDFWFAEASATPLAFVRIGYGVLLFAWAATLFPDVTAFFGPDRLAGSDVAGARWSVFEIADDTAVVWAVYAVLLGAAVAVALGWRTRLSAVVAFVALVSLQRWNVWVLNSGDLLLRHLGLFVALGASGAALSLDRRRAGTTASARRAVWPLRLIQIQIAAMYLFSVWAKARGATWADGSAVGYALRVGDLIRFPTPGFVTSDLVVTNLITYGTLFVEIAIPLLVWNRRARPWVLGAGAAMHLMIDATITVGFFSYTVIVAYLAFVPPETADAWVARWRARRDPVASADEGFA